MTAKSFPFSDLIRKQTSVFPALDDADVILERRDAENLVLSRSERFEAKEAATRLLARTLAIIARSNRSLAEEVFAEELPWLKWLPETGRTEAVSELLDQLIAGADTGLFIPFARDLAAWRSTAEIYAQPELARRLTGPFDPADFTEVTRPGTAE
ncbi:MULTISPECIES: hypothetical protein [Nocardia]|uniref:Uncharacterized protein n=2 Tax=Nocardia TaxID=1817 RepID=A0ABW7WKD0_9NOCA|nr:MULTISPECIES: hypothetical protein [unclassified Nocardia]MBF6190470.1 hypothetical protein [Nocardia beijingensis]MEA3528378.1 hypothetical protein [Nocardia sp. CDC192]MEB3512470.1 hypothetical protein [Nocardia sp. CDC186]